MIHPVSVACAKPDLRYQRSMPVAAEEVSRLIPLEAFTISLHWVVSTIPYLFMYSRQTGEEHSRASDRSPCWDLKPYTRSSWSQRILSLFLKKFSRAAFLYFDATPSRKSNARRPRFHGRRRACKNRCLCMILSRAPFYGPRELFFHRKVVSACVVTRETGP